MPKQLPISVVIPTFNRAFFLQEALESVRKQTAKPLEVIVVDDGSTDNTREICEKEFPEFTTIRQPNKGVAAARNAGIRQAKGEWLAFLDSDDLWLPKKLEKQWEFLQANPTARIAQTEEIWFRNGVRVNPKKKYQKQSGWIFEASVAFCLVSPSAVIIHKEIFEKVGLFDEGQLLCEDYDLWLRISLHYPILTQPDHLITKRNGEHEQLSKVWGQDIYRIRALRKILEDPKLSLQQRELVQADLLRREKIVDAGREKRLTK